MFSEKAASMQRRLEAQKDGRGGEGRRRKGSSKLVLFGWVCWRDKKKA